MANEFVLRKGLISLGGVTFPLKQITSTYTVLSTDYFIDATSGRMELEEEKVLINIQRYGNTTSATLPLLLSDFEDKFKKGDNLIFAAFGGGFTWGSVYLKWAYNK